MAEQCEPEPRELLEAYRTGAALRASVGSMVEGVETLQKAVGLVYAASDEIENAIDGHVHRLDRVLEVAQQLLAG